MALISHIKAVFSKRSLLMWVQKDKQTYTYIHTYVHTYIHTHTYFLENNFSKPGMHLVKNFCLLCYRCTVGNLLQLTRGQVQIQSLL